MRIWGEKYFSLVFKHNLFLYLQTHELDPTKHYLRLKFFMENQTQFYIPKPEEDIYDLVYLTAWLEMIFFLTSRKPSWSQT